MKGTPARHGGLEGPLTSKPTWSNTSGYSTTSAFFFGLEGNSMSLLLLVVLGFVVRNYWTSKSGAPAAAEKIQTME